MNVLTLAANAHSAMLGFVVHGDAIDDIKLNFNPASLLTLDIVIALIMFGIALAIKVADFKAVLTMPKAISVAIAAQFLLLPAITFGLTLLLQVQASIALGMILVACCPPGNISQVLTNQARGNVALSVSMTAIGNLLAIFLMPLNFAFWGNLHPTASQIFKDVDLNAWEMMLKIVLIIGLPFALGILIGHYWPKITAKVQPWIRIISLVALLAFIVIALVGNWANFMMVLGVVLIVVFLHDSIALALGYATARAFRLDTPSTKAVTFEVGIRNAGLGLGLIFSIFGGLGGMAVVAGWWGIWDIIAGLILATVWSRFTLRKQKKQQEPVSA